MMTSITRQIRKFKGSELSEECLVQVGARQGSVLSPLLFANAVDAISENAREGLINEIMNVDDLVLMSESIENLKKFLKWKEESESKGLKVNLKKTKMMVGGLKGEAFRSKVDPSVKCGKRVMENLVMCTNCSKWVYGRCAKRKRVTSTHFKMIADTDSFWVQPKTLVFY